MSHYRRLVESGIEMKVGIHNITGEFSKSWTRTPLREYNVWWSQEKLLVVYRLDNKDNRGFCHLKFITTIILIFVSLIFIFKMFVSDTAGISSTKYSYLLSCPYSLLTCSHECRPQLSPNPVWASVTATSLIKHKQLSDWCMPMASENVFVYRGGGGAGRRYGRNP